MDVTDEESILNVKTFIEEKEGKLHVLVNKFVHLCLNEILAVFQFDLILHQRSPVRSDFTLSQQ